MTASLINLSFFLALALAALLIRSILRQLDQAEIDAWQKLISLETPDDLTQDRIHKNFRDPAYLSEPDLRPVPAAISFWRIDRPSAECATNEDAHEIEYPAYELPRSRCSETGSLHQSA